MAVSPGLPGCLADHTLPEQGPYSRSPAQSGPDPPGALSAAEPAWEARMSW